MKNSKSTPSEKWQNAIKQLTQTLHDYDEYFNRTQKQFQFIRELDQEIQTATIDITSVYKLIFEKGLKDYVKYDNAHIMEISGDDVVITYSNDESKITTTYGKYEGLCGVALKEERDLNIGDIHISHYAKNYQEIHSETQSELVIRMIDRTKTKILGLFNLEKNSKGKFTSQEVEFCELIAGQLCIAIEQVKIWKGIQLISDFNNQLLSGDINLATIYQNLLEKLLKILDFNYGGIVQLIKQKQAVVVANDRKEYINYILENSIVEQIIINEKSKSTVILNNLKKSKYYQYYTSLTSNKDVKSELIVPLVANDEIIGAINIEDTRLNAFSKFDIHIIEILSRLIANTMEAGTRRRNNKVEKAKEVDFVLVQLGHISVDYLHKIGGTISNLRYRLNEFVDRVDEINLPIIGEYTGIEYLDSIHNGMKDLELYMTKLKKEYDPTQMDLQPKPVDIVQKTDEILKMYTKKLPKNICINFHPFKHPKTHQIMKLECALSTQFSSVLEVLIDNAVDSMPEGGNITIEFDLVNLLEVQIAIRDEGRGIRDEDKAKIYNYRFTTKSNYKGQGLGMWFVKTYVERFQGNIFFESKEKKGTTFYITFPLKASLKR